MYDGILLTERAKRGYSRFFRILLRQEDGAVLRHCSAGKDRAGLASALLLYALGADNEYGSVSSYLNNALRVMERLRDRFLEG